MYGEYQSRYYQPKEYQPFGASIDEYSRQIYGAYQSRWSTLKTAYQLAMGYYHADGVDWVDIATLSPTTDEMTLHQMIVYISGAWAGQTLLRIMVNGIRVYPFKTYEVVISGATLPLWNLAVRLRLGDEMAIQTRSNNAGDTGAAFKTMADVYYTILKSGV